MTYMWIISHLYGLACILPEFIHWNSNPLYLSANTVGDRVL